MTRFNTLAALFLLCTHNIGEPSALAQPAPEAATAISDSAAHRTTSPGAPPERTRQSGRRLRLVGINDGPANRDDAPGPAI